MYERFTMIEQIKNIFYIALFVGGIFGHTQAIAEVNDMVCGSLQTAYGPYDYRSDKEFLPVVEAHHFTPEVENLRSGNFRHPGSTVGGDLNYTLHAFPNHHRALMSMVRYGDRARSERPPYTSHTIECFLYRAWRFRPDDGMVRLIYATYLAKRSRSKEALEHLNDAISLGVDSANAYYNIGLVYFDLKDFEMSMSYAHKAYQMGYSLPGLRDRLKKLGHWKDPDVIGSKGEESNNSLNN